MITKVSLCVWIVITLIGCCLAAEYLDTKPAFLKDCQRKLPDEMFVPCSTESMQGLYRQFKTGIDGLDASFDPIKIKEIKILSSDGPVSMNISLTNAVVKGLSDAIVLRNNINPVDYSWESIFRIPKLRLEGKYEMNGRILLIPLQGRGNCWIEPQNMENKVHAEAKLYEKFGQTFFNLTKVQVDFSMSGLRLQFDNLFNGIKLLEDSTNEFLNENWKTVSDAFKPLIQKTVDDISVETLNKVFSSMPAKYFVSDIPHPSELYKTDKN